MKYFFTLILCLGLFSSSLVQAQEETKKVVVVKKMKDSNGKTTTERKEATGKEADELIKQMKKDGTLEGIDIDVEIEKAKEVKKTKKSVERRISIEEKEENGEIVKTYEITTIEDGDKKVMKWSGDGEMPEEMAKIIKEEEMRAGGSGDEKEIKTIEIISEDGEDEKVMFWSGDGEVPKEMKEALGDDVKIIKKLSDDGETMTIIVETDEDVEIHEDHGKHKKFKMRKKHKDHDAHENHFVEKKVRKESPNKVTLGVMIEDDSQGVVVSEVVEASVAESAGLKSGDTIIKVGDTYVFNTDMLLSALSAYDKGDKVKVTFLRNGKEKKVKAKF